MSDRDASCPLPTLYQSRSLGCVPCVLPSPQPTTSPRLLLDRQTDRVRVRSKPTGHGLPDGLVDCLCGRKPKVTPSGCVPSAPFTLSVQIQMPLALALALSRFILKVVDFGFFGFAKQLTRGDLSPSPGSSLNLYRLTPCRHRDTQIHAVIHSGTR